MSGYVDVEVDGKEMDVFLAKPQGAGPFPAVLIMFHRGGIDAFTTGLADKLADAGYIAAAPNFFHRRPKDEDPEEIMKARLDSEVKADLDATVAYLQAKPTVQTENFAIIGHCMGGRMAFFGACVNPVFNAAAIYYSGNMFGAWGDGPTPFERLKDISCPVIGFFGRDDVNPSPADVDKLSAELTGIGIAHDFHSYEGAGHAFQNFLNANSFREEAAKDSWEKTLAFFAETLGAGAEAATA